MNETNHKTGYFVFSLDTELAWGTIDWDQQRSNRTSRDGQKERETIQHLLDLMAEFGISATWAITGHLFYEKCEECASCPVLDLRGQDFGFEEIWRARGSLWYGADIVDKVLGSSSGHEIACHGYTHRFFDRLSREQARLEIEEWLRLAKRRNILPQTVVFPQDRIGHLELFQEAGFICYRGRDVRHPALSIPFLGKVLYRMNRLLPLLIPQVYEIRMDSKELVSIPSSQWLFRFDRRMEQSLDSLHLQNLRFQATVKGIEKAAQEKKVIHLWAHPHEFRTERDLEKLRFLFGRYARLAKEGRLQSITMADLAKQISETHHAVFDHSI